MTRTNTTSPFALVPSFETAWQDVDSSLERFCLTAGGQLERAQPGLLNLGGKNGTLFDRALFAPVRR
jgi:hypothetical protein